MCILMQLRELVSACGKTIGMRREISCRHRGHACRLLSPQTTGSIQACYGMTYFSSHNLKVGYIAMYTYLLTMWIYYYNTSNYSTAWLHLSVMLGEMLCSRCCCIFIYIFWFYMCAYMLCIWGMYCTTYTMMTHIVVTLQWLANDNTEMPENRTWWK